MRKFFVHATFSAVALEEGFNWWCQQLWPDGQVSYAGFDTLFQCVFDPDAFGLSEATGTLVLALNPASLKRLESGTLTLDGFRAALAQLARQPQLRVVLALLDDPTTGQSPQCASLTGIPGVIEISPEQIARFLTGPVVADGATATAAGIPYSRHYLAAVSTAIAWRLDQVERPVKKALVLDCDHTIWTGVVGEDGIDGLVVTDRHRRLTRIARRLREAGWLLCLCSKNEVEDVQAALSALDTGIAWADLAAVRINWDDKASNLRALASELNLGLESFVFVDDNPVECARVQADLPEVSVLHVDPASDNRWLENVWLFEQRALTDEDRVRARFYADNRQRASLRDQLGSRRDFLDALDIEVSIAPAATGDVQRIEQLTLRTNQFNFSGLKLDDIELNSRIADPEQLVLRAQLSDRFGDYGLIGATTARRVDDQLIVDGFWLSCRALGRGVEHQLVRALATAAHDHGLNTLAFTLKELPRNRPARQFADTLENSTHPGEPRCIATATALAIEFDPEQSGSLGPDNRQTAGQRSSRPASVDYAAVARAAMDREVLRAIEATTSPRPEIQRPCAPPRHDLERTLVRIWSETLSLETVGIHDEFEELGGRSIQLVTIHTRIREQLGCELEFVDLFRFTSVAALAGHLEGSAQARSLSGVSQRTHQQRRASRGFRRIDRSRLRA